MIERLIERYWLYNEPHNVWSFYSSEYDVWGNLAQQIRSLMDGVEFVAPVFELFYDESELQVGWRSNSNATRVQAEAAKEWGERNKLFDKSTQGVRRVDMVPDVIDF